MSSESERRPENQNEDDKAAPLRPAFVVLVLFSLLSLASGLGLASLRQKSCTYDEPYFIRGAEQVLSGAPWPALDRRSIRRASSPDMAERSRFYSDHAPLLHPPLGAYLQGLLGPLDGILAGAGELGAARIKRLCLIPILGLAVFLWTTELYGQHAGFAALSMFCFSPNMLAHARLVTVDFLLSATFFIAAYAYWRLRRRPSWPRLFAAGLGLGLACLAKYPALMLIPIFLLASGALAFLESDREPLSEALARRIPNHTRRKLIEGLAMTLAVFTIATFVIALGYRFQGCLSLKPGFLAQSAAGALVDNPLGRAFFYFFPSPYLDGIELQLGVSRSGFDAFLMGEHSQTGWWYYFALAALIKTPISSILLALAGAALLLRNSGARQDAVLILLPPLFLALYFSFFNKINIGLRYILPVYPFAFLLAGSLWRDFSSKKRAVQGLLLGALALSILAGLSIHPHYLAYFNESIGGPQRGYRYLIDSNLDWGQDDALIERYLKARAGAVTRISYEQPGPVSGLVAINANRLQGIAGRSRAPYRWLDSYQPIAFVGYSWLIYKIPPGQVPKPPR